MRNKKRMTVDPGNMLFALYVGCVLCIIFLALVVDGYAAVDRGERAEIRPAGRMSGLKKIHRRVAESQRAQRENFIGKRPAHMVY